MPYYVKTSFMRLKHVSNENPTHSFAPYEPPTYGTKMKYAPIEGSDENLLGAEVKLLQKVAVVFLYCTKSIANTMLVSTKNLAASQTKGTSVTLEDRVCLLDYAATHQISKLRYHASGMILYMHRDGSCLSVSNCFRRARYYFSFSDNRQEPDKVRINSPTHSV